MTSVLRIFLPLLLVAAAPPPVAERAQERELMVLTVANMAATAGTKHSRIDDRVLDALRTVPRHLLVPEEVRAEAYRNVPLPIGYDATISQPYVVALMTDLLDVGPDDVVLEVGTGSGYQAAILAHLARKVYSIEIVEALATRAAGQLARLGYEKVAVRAGDGYLGWPEEAPFDRIIVTAGADHLPQPLIDQLRPGGRMVIPVGTAANELQLLLVTKNSAGKISKSKVLPVRFVPLQRRKMNAR